MKAVAPLLILAAGCASPGLYGVGAQKGFAGEITIVDGRVYATRADVEGTEHLETATVRAWRETRVERDFEPDLDGPFLIEGEFTDLRSHIVDGGCPKRGGKALELRHDRVRALLVGIGPHLHVVFEDGTTAHVDAVTVRAGSILRTPR